MAPYFVSPRSSGSGATTTTLRQPSTIIVAHLATKNPSCHGPYINDSIDVSNARPTSHGTISGRD